MPSSSIPTPEQSDSPVRSATRRCLRAFRVIQNEVRVQANAGFADGLAADFAVSPICMALAALVAGRGPALAILDAQQVADGFDKLLVVHASTASPLHSR